MPVFTICRQMFSLIRQSDMSCFLQSIYCFADSFLTLLTTIIIFCPSCKMGSAGLGSQLCKTQRVLHRTGICDKETMKRNCRCERREIGRTAKQAPIRACVQVPSESKYRSESAPELDKMYLPLFRNGFQSIDVRPTSSAKIWSVLFVSGLPGCVGSCACSGKFFELLDESPNLLKPCRIDSCVACAVGMSAKKARNSKKLLIKSRAAMDANKFGWCLGPTNMQGPRRGPAPPEVRAQRIMLVTGDGAIRI